MADNILSEAKRYLVFKIGEEEYGIDIRKITTIIEKDMEIARVPKLPTFLKGVINLRGEIIPVMSMRLKLGLSEDSYGPDTRIIIISLDEVSAGLIVDSVAEVIEFNDESIESIANIAGELSFDYIAGVGKAEGKIVTLLNLDRLIYLEE
ncbi:MAG: chemotaxis protein CheW [Clostridiaceae bacterium]|jgi:purine-binding chemotaxis protein CheW|nr:chemotaxis protein CheW [Clostridiaceae bacterium]